MIKYERVFLPHGWFVAERPVDFISGIRVGGQRIFAAGVIHVCVYQPAGGTSCLSAMTSMVKTTWPHRLFHHADRILPRYPGRFFCNANRVYHDRANMGQEKSPEYDTIRR